MESYLPLFIQLLAGALGGNLAAKLFPGISMGFAGNSLAGILGGGLGGLVLGWVGVGSPEGGMDLVSILGSVAGGGLGGGIIMAGIGALRNAFVK